MTHHPVEGAPSVNFAADFLERLAPLLEAEPRVAALQIPEMYLKRAAMDEPVAREFTWLNAKIRVASTEAQRVEYHAWSFHAAIRSEDTWEPAFVAFATMTVLSVDRVPLPSTLVDLEGLEASLSAVRTGT